MNGPNGWERDAGLVALAAFAVLYLVVVAQLRTMRNAGTRRSGRLLVRMWAGLVLLLALTAVPIPAIKDTPAASSPAPAAGSSCAGGAGAGSGRLRAGCPEPGSGVRRP
ncbi:MAG: hypothetical protein QOH97_3821 [Actinoplanes sp.]|nr:hypothetical protein [Actinoplanes sp.]